MHLEMPLVIGLMVAAIVLAIAAKRARMPYNVALVVGGLLISMGNLLPGVPPLDPEVVFLVCLPALLFEGGITADLSGIRANALPILILSTLGMVLAIGATGTALHVLLALPLWSALLLGALLSVTDTVSILYAFRRAPVPPRLSGIMQGESLFNDGTALVAYAAIASVVAGATTPSVPMLAARVLLASAGGAVVGLALGMLGGFVIRRTEDPLAEIMVTTAVALASFVVAEQLHLSGAISAVVAGLAVGAALRKDVSPQSQVAIHSFWEYATFGVNTFLFLAVGLTTRPETLRGYVPQTLLAMGCVIAGRAVAIYGPFLLLKLVRPAEAVPPRWQHVFIFGNIKGALSIGLALGLPASTPGREQLLAVTFGVTLISLVGQGLLLTRALKWLGLFQQDEVALAMSEQRGRLIASRAAHQELAVLHEQGLVPRAAYDHLRSEYQVNIARAERELRRLNEHHLAQGAKDLITMRRRLIDAERTALQGARRSGLIPETTAEHMLAQLDERTLNLEKMLHGAHGDDAEVEPGRKAS
ncbi:cation:proton antiporter [Myxococcus stipitatus]|uniref:cation:proton antiporter n=1 Tax=Myxococcus stipitatus TaxID=83455 RepID=UPI001F1EEC16|nr:cation:proton antiporter [Myxococcus stipitatus]MCE9670783.1 cation:proton antiporter [Myxococcus stipitatus]